MTIEHFKELYDLPHTPLVRKTIALERELAEAQLKLRHIEQHIEQYKDLMKQKGNKMLLHERDAVIYTLEKILEASVSGGPFDGT